MGLDKVCQEVYAMVIGLYYDLSADYATQLWKEFTKSLEHTSVVKGISCARYWSLILEKVYEKEGIKVPHGEETATITKYQFPKTITDDAQIFTSVARIPNAMLKKVNPTYKILIKYLQSLILDVETCVLLEVEVVSSKSSKKMKTDEEHVKAAKSKSTHKNVGGDDTK